MSEPKYAYRLPPCPVYDLEGTESWLSDMAQRGYLLSRDGFFAGFGVFEKTEPRTMRYRLEAAPKKGGLFSDEEVPSEEEQEISEALGWVYVGRRGPFYIYGCSDPEARELHTDPEVQSMTVDLLRRRERNNLIAAIIETLLILVFIVLGRCPLLLVLSLGTPLTLLTLALFLSSLLDNIRRLRHYRQLRLRLMAGDEPDHQKDWRSGAKRHYLYGLAQVVLILAWVALILNMWMTDLSEEDHISLFDFTGSVPFATAADFGPEHELHDIGFSNYIVPESDLLAPEIITYREQFRVTMADGRKLSGGLYVDYLELPAPFLAREAARELVAEDRFEKYFEPFDIHVEGVDSVFGYYEHGVHLVMHKGCRAIRVMCYQTSEDQLSIPELAAIVAAGLQ